MRYPAVVERHFEHPANVGPLSPAPRHSCCGEAGSAAGGTWIVIQAEIDDGRIRRLVFKAFGCPHTIAACSRTTEVLIGAPVSALLGFDPEAVASELEIPPEKLGRLLILQDALRNCFRDWDTTQPAAAHQGAH